MPEPEELAVRFATIALLRQADAIAELEGAVQELNGVLALLEMGRRRSRIVIREKI